MKKTFVLAGVLGVCWCATAVAQGYAPVGPQTNVPVSTVTGGGWVECYQDFYANGPVDLTDVLADCNGSRLMLACRPSGSDTLTVLAQALREDVLFDTGTGNTPHNANGVGWYFNGFWSWGFADEGDAISRNSCDVENSGNNDQRLCWHTDSGKELAGGAKGAIGILLGGYRCGATEDLNNATDWDRIIYTDLPTGAVPTLSWLGLGLLALVLGGVAWRRFHS